MKYYIKSGRGLMSSNAFRYGHLSLDTDTQDSATYSYNSLSTDFMTLNYIFDTNAHMYGAKMQDAEDWDNYELNATPLKMLFVDLFNRLEDDITDITGSDTTDIVYVDVNVDIFGVGNRVVTASFRVYGQEDHETGEISYPIEDILSANHKLELSYLDDSFVYNLHTIDPNSTYMKRRFCPQVVKYLSQGNNM